MPDNTTMIETAMGERRPGEQRTGESRTGELRTGELRPSELRPSEPQLGAAGLTGLKRNPAQLAALERIRTWTRERFGLTEDDAIVVAEVACRVPGCPPLETAVAFWADGNIRHQFKIFKPAQAVAESDLPFAWLKEALAVPDGFGCDCC